MRRIRHISWIVLGLAIGCSGTGAPAVVGSGVELTEIRPFGDATRLSFRGQGDLTFEPGPGRVLMTADDNIIPLTVMEVRGDTLHIELPPNIQPKTPIVFQVSIPLLTNLSIEGAAKARIQGVETDEFRLTSQGSSSIDIVGTADQLAISLNGATTLKATELVVREARVSVNGAAKAEVNASDKLDVSIAGAGSVTYHGSPTLTQQVAGVGSVKKAP